MKLRCMHPLSICLAWPPTVERLLDRGTDEALGALWRLSLTWSNSSQLSMKVDQ